MLTAFYAAFTTVSFTLLGLWMFVVQTRRLEWVRSPVHLRRAYAIHVMFALIGLMSMLALVDPESKALWRLSFSFASAAGAVALFVLRGAGARRSAVVQWSMLAVAVLFVGVFLDAAVTDLPDKLGSGLSPLELEAILLSLVSFGGVNVAWLLMFDEVPDDQTDAELDRERGI